MKEKIIFIFFVFLFMSLVSLSLLIVANVSKNFFIQRIQYAYRMLLAFYSKSKLTLYLICKLFSVRNSILAELIFTIYVFMYKHYYQDYENWGYDTALFPNGKGDLANLYLWIIITRPINYNLAAQISYDEKSQSIIYLGTCFKGIRYHINQQGALVIKPSDTGECSYAEFLKLHTKIYQELYKLDKEKCMWLIDRRIILGL